ncbi:MAG: DUF1257 domain-containing protein [Thermoguttaceae bacterium]
MSHIVTVNVEVRDFDAVRSACRRLNLKEPVRGLAKMFDGNAEGVIVKLPDWLYPVVCVLETGELQYDNFGGKWGDEKYLRNFVQMYGVEKATLEARRKGYSVIEQQLTDGSVKLTVNVGGAL